jgi:pilus assembly protein Flp/PilA
MKAAPGERIVQLFVDETGATATEYAVMLVLILLVAFATIIFLGQKVDEAFNTFATMFAGAGS